VAIEDEIAAEVTARAMGWEPLEGEEGTRIWVRSEDIGVNDAPYCDTALQVVRSYTLENDAAGFPPGLLHLFALV
jgi:hypothetical protein